MKKYTKDAIIDRIMFLHPYKTKERIMYMIYVMYKSPRLVMRWMRRKKERPPYRKYTFYEACKMAQTLGKQGDKAWEEFHAYPLEDL